MCTVISINKICQNCGEEIGIEHISGCEDDNIMCPNCFHIISTGINFNFDNKNIKKD